MTTDAAEGFRCSLASLQREEDVAGTATNVRTWLLLEHPGPWGVKALLDARLPDGLGRELTRRAAEHRAKILLIRRHGSRPDSPHGLRVFAASTDPAGPRIERGLLTDPREILDVYLAALRAGGSSGLDPHDEPLWGVCTHGKHDACCAEHGRPLAAALSAAYPEQTWEISHVGGDRFAGNLVVLPHGLYYGRLDPASALTAVGKHLTGHLDLDHLRGSSAWPMSVQAAEIAVRRQLGLTGLDEVVPVSHSRTDDLVTVDVRAGSVTYRVVLQRIEGEPSQLTCSALRPSPTVRHEIVSLEPGE